jgi:hypothetical protein
MAHEMAREIVKQPGVRQELKHLALEAIRAAWQSMQKPADAADSRSS